MNHCPCTEGCSYTHLEPTKEPQPCKEGKSPHGMGKALTGWAEHHQCSRYLQPWCNTSQFRSREATAPHPTFTSASLLPRTHASDHQCSSKRHLIRLLSDKAAPRRGRRNRPLNRLSHPESSRLRSRLPPPELSPSSSNSYFILTSMWLSFGARQSEAAESGSAQTVPSKLPRNTDRTPA